MQGHGSTPKPLASAGCPGTAQGSAPSFAAEFRGHFPPHLNQGLPSALRQPEHPQSRFSIPISSPHWVGLPRSGPPFAEATGSWCVLGAALSPARLLRAPRSRQRVLCLHRPLPAQHPAVWHLPWPACMMFVRVWACPFGSHLQCHPQYPGQVLLSLGTFLIHRKSERV